MEETEPLPKWMMRRYALLYRKFKDTKFTLEQCVDEIKEDKKVILVLLSRMRKMGWVEVEFDKDDARKRIYSLKPMEHIIERMKVEK